ncbi:MAG: prepilin peptidase [Oscillospiraceae bacterium]
MELETLYLVIKIILSVFVFLFGLCIGSFLNVLIYRMPLGLDFVHRDAHSMCTTCKHELKWYDLVPLFSFLFLGGKCRYCKAKISYIYPFVEALNAFLYLFAYGYACNFTPSLAMLAYALIIPALIVIVFIDFKHQIIPDSMWITVLLGGIVLYIDEIIKNGFNISALISRIVGFFLVSVILLLIGYLTGGMGGGDVKLMAAAGFLLGWKNVLLALILGGVVGVIFLGITKTLKKGDMKKEVPFGPHLAVGIFVAMFFGNNMLNWYMSFFA